MRFPSWLPTLLGFLTAVGPISTDMYLPAFPAIEAAMGGRPGTAQITLAMWFLGLAIGQITQGPLSDRFGRRGPLVIGTALYTAASIGCALAPNLTILSLMRFLAAIGGSASTVVPRAVVRDLSDGHAAARMMSQLILVMGVAPILAPTLGGFVDTTLGWQAIFWLAAIYGGVCAGVVWFLMPETLPPPRRTRLSLTEQVVRYRAIITERGFASHALIGACAFFGVFAYLGGAPGVFIDRFHLSPAQFGMLFGTCAAGYIAASQVNPRLMRLLGPSAILRGAVWTYVVATIVLTALAFSEAGPWWLVAAPILVSMGCMGFVNPGATVGALSRHAAHAGSASALMGTMQFCLGGVSGLVVGVFADGTARPMACLMLLGALTAAMADLCRPKR
ncbi:MAG TPA: multidrug effflux MFS transporter [Rhodopila sp.]|uniref:multidrug effflux MFS transporter n=1 Tax=Rhodopila sp. TaxID=2480087 RepID=UPI002CF7D353|nr:multidrug effflux MFS transporter [Rhodopila sp.]HVY14686.1 multidrug effflux MFS transporter [Rhodopila sp.]